MLSLADALKYVNRLTTFGKQFREYAVSDFLLYRDWIEPPITSLDELQKTWALYLKWKALCDANPSQWSSSNGQQFTQSPSARKFRYINGASSKIAPTLHLMTDPRQPGMKEAELKGVGQCEYFATQAYQALKAGGDPGKVPRVDKISTPGHNWVLVNYSPDDGNDEDSESPNWIAVDYWLLALGVPRAKCICAWSEATLKFKPPFQFVETFNPHKEV
jgi:hypothetical protein